MLENLQSAARKPALGVQLLSQLGIFKGGNGQNFRHSRQSACDALTERASFALVLSENALVKNRLQPKFYHSAHSCPHHFRTHALGHEAL